MAHTKQSIFIHAPLAQVFHYTANPENWAHFNYNLSTPKSISGNGEAGTIVETDYSILGMHVPVTIQVTECEASAGHAKWNGMMSGSLSAQQTHFYTAKDGGTELTIELDIFIPDDFFGKITDKLIYKRLDENSAKHSLENIKSICETSA